MNEEKRRALQGAFEPVVKPERLRGIMDAYDLILRDVAEASDGKLHPPTVWRLAEGKTTGNTQIRTLNKITNALVKIIGLESRAELRHLIQEDN